MSEIDAASMDALAVALAEGLAEQLAKRVAEQVVAELSMSPQHWHREPVYLAWSGLCWFGEHGRCNGAALRSENGCHCPHHRGEPIPSLGYVVRLVERTAEGDGQ